MGTYQNEAEKIISEMMEGWELAQQVLSEFWLESTIDEMAVLFHDHSDVLSFLSQAVSLPETELFNYSEDSVTTRPIPSAYRVQYWFLTTPSHKFRIEAMVCSQGSLVHDMLRRMRSQNTIAVHASFKCATEESYVAAGVLLRQAGWECWQRCDSSYGRFAYYGNPDSQLGWLLKPRLNLRDQSVVTEENNE